jgi:hypothetical protein
VAGQIEKEIHLSLSMSWKAIPGFILKGGVMSEISYSEKLKVSNSHKSGIRVCSSYTSIWVGQSHERWLQEGYGLELDPLENGEIGL